MKKQESDNNIYPIIDGDLRLAQLQQSIEDIIYSSQFKNITKAAVVGVLEIVKNDVIRN